MSDVLIQLFQFNVAAATAILVVLALRPLVRRAFGVGLAYALWLIVPLVGLAMIAPPRLVVIATEASSSWSWAESTVASTLAPRGGTADGWALLCTLWVVGALVALARLAWRQAAFNRAACEGRAGPAVVGVLRPTIVTPKDFAERYTPAERAIVLAHEATHIRRQDARVNALMAVARCANWFNPLFHLMATAIRMDQELACDAQVVNAHPGSRRTYAEAMLKAQLAIRPLPLGCYWPMSSPHPLAERIRFLSAYAPSPPRKRLGWAVVAVVGVAASASAWAARPPEIVLLVPAAGVSEVTLAPQRTEPATAWTGPISVSTRLAPSAADPARSVADSRGAALAQGPGEAVPPQIGSVIRVAASVTAPDGLTLTSDVTSAAPVDALRTSDYRWNRSEYGLRTEARQRPDGVWIAAAMTLNGESVGGGQVVLAPGATTEIPIGNGGAIRVTATLRAETAEEAQARARRPKGVVETDCLGTQGHGCS